MENSLEPKVKRVYVNLIEKLFNFLRFKKINIRIDTSVKHLLMADWYFLRKKCSTENFHLVLGLPSL